ncbi:MAG: hypothetical protein ABR551_01410, partial [Gemmatimonadales bacterium]
MIWILGALAAAAALQFVGWWLLAVVAFVWGVALRSGQWPATRIAAVVMLLAVLRLGWVGLRGGPVGEAGELVAATVAVPGVVIWLAAILLP